MNALDARRDPGAERACQTQPIRLLLVDDHPIVREGLGFCLRGQRNLEIVGKAGDGKEAVRKACRLLPDVILMDIEMPRMNGLAATEWLRKELPQIKVLILSMYNSAEYVVRILQSGARGYVMKDAAPKELVRAIQTVHAGGTCFSAEVARLALNQLVRQAAEGAKMPLSQREREVCVRVAEGCSTKDIANVLGIGVRTVETHRERIMRKLDIHTVAGLTKFAVARGLVIP